MTITGRGKTWSINRVNDTLNWEKDGIIFGRKFSSEADCIKALTVYAEKRIAEGYIIT